MRHKSAGPVLRCPAGTCGRVAFDRQGGVTSRQFGRPGKNPNGIVGRSPEDKFNRRSFHKQASHYQVGVQEREGDSSQDAAASTSALLAQARCGEKEGESEAARARPAWFRITSGKSDI